MLVVSDPEESPAAVPSACSQVASPTPYLDRELPLPGPNWGYRRIPLWQTSLIIALFLLRTPFEVYLLILAVTLVHELGHCLAGWIAGLEFGQIRVGPLSVDCDKRLNWEWNRGTIVGGEALMLPKGKSAIRARLSAYILGGPIANIGVGISFLHILPEQDTHFAGLVRLFLAGSFIIGIGNLVPLRRYGFSSDGMKLGLLLLNKSQRWILARQASSY